MLLPASAAFGAYSSGTQSVFVTNSAPEAIELADWVASPTYPGWYWSVSDVWKTTDTFVACAGLEGSPLNDCRKVQRARLWAFKLDPTTHVVVETRAFALSDPAWALDPYNAENNDWEDMALSPARTDADGTTAENLLIGATGNSVRNPARDASGRNITCDTRRLIELREPDLSDATSSVWSPWKIYDIKNVVSTYGQATCNVEALVQAPEASGAPRAYLITRAGGKVLSRSLEPETRP